MSINTSVTSQGDHQHEIKRCCATLPEPLHYCWVGHLLMQGVITLGMETASQSSRGTLSSRKEEKECACCLQDAMCKLITWQSPVQASKWQGAGALGLRNHAECIEYREQQDRNVFSFILYRGKLQLTKKINP